MISTKPTTCVFPSLSKIPYGGFSPVRLQTEIQPPPSTKQQELSAARMPPTETSYKWPESWHPDHATHQRVDRRKPSAPGLSGAIPSNARRFRPEALGSAAGYHVPPPRRLLWPHPSLSFSSTRLCIRGWLLQPRGLPRAENDRFPNLLLVSLPSCHPLYPGGPDDCLWLCFIIHASLRPIRTGSASTSSPPIGSREESVTRLQGSLDATAQRLARPSPTRTFTFELSPAGSLRTDVEYNYAGKQPIPATGLTPVRNKALWAANGWHG
jgi:hypothetical protein